MSCHPAGDPDGAPAGAAPAPRRALSLDDGWEGAAAEDRPESWGERTESDDDRLAHYRAQRPPHHGG